MRGSYVLIIRVKNPVKIEVGKLGSIHFMQGYYAYVGSAMNSMEARVRRHLRKDNKKLFWHIDYLLSEQDVVVEDVLVIPDEKRMECAIAGLLMNHFEAVPGFGCSDCRCKSHLFHLGNRGNGKKYMLLLRSLLRKHFISQEAIFR